MVVAYVTHGFPHDYRCDDFAEQTTADYLFFEVVRHLFHDSFSGIFLNCIKRIILGYP